MMDGDGSHDPKYINEMFKQSKNFDIVVGSKYMPGGRTEDQGRRVIVSKAFNFCITSFLGLKMKDVMSGYAMFNKKIFDRIVLRPKGFKLLMEIVYKSKAPVKEIPVIFYKRKAGKSKVGYNFSGVKEAWRIFSLAWSLRFGKA
jgi:dolichol-phosphate mannosyltransferase